MLRRGRGDGERMLMTLFLSQVTTSADKMAPSHLMIHKSEKKLGGCSWENDDLPSLSIQVIRIESEEYLHTS